jgi:predicted enzyme related to lactoylglutathione lyase
MIKGVAFIAYAVRDVPRSVAFYRDVVGLPVGTVFNDAYVEFDTGSAVFAVDGEPPGAEPGTCSGVAFEVDDIDEAQRRLLKHGVKVSEVYEFAPCWICFAEDPDGNRFSLHRLKQPS